MTAIEHPLVSVVDDDESVRESLPVLLRQVGFETRSFSSAEEFLTSDCIRETRCLILDLAMPGMSGPELLQELRRLGQEIPTVFISGEKDQAIRARLLKQGAREFLSKPLNVETLVATVKTALGADEPAKIGNEIHNDKRKRSG